MIYLIFFAVIILLLIYQWYQDIGNEHWKLKNIVYVPKTTPLGIMWELTKSKVSLPELYKNICDKYPEESNIGFFMGLRPALLVRDPVNIQHVLASDFQNFHSRGIVTSKDDVLADNVLFMEDYKRWKLTRQKVSPVFTNVKLKAMFYILDHCGSEFSKFIDENIDKDAFHLLISYSAASVGAAVFGIDTTTKNTMDSPFIQMSKQAVAPTLQAKITFYIGNTWPRIQKLLNIKTFGQHEEFFVGVVKDVLKQRRKDGQKQHDFIDLCLELQKNGTMNDPQTGYKIEPTDKVLAAQAFFFFIAGTDTAANAMYFTLLELSKNLDYLAKVHSEIDSVFIQNDDHLTFEAINKLTYLEMAYLEAMRLYPPVALLQRICNRDSVLPEGNVKINKGTVIVIPTMSLHKDERFFSDAEKFKPDRFSASNIAKIVKFTYLPYGEGNRACLGARFARLHVLAGLAWFLRKYTLEPAPTAEPTKFEPNFFGLHAAGSKFRIIHR